MWFIAALAFLPTAAFAECNDYVARRYPHIRLHEEKMKMSVHFEKWTVPMDKIILKTFGVLTDGGVEMENPDQRLHFVVHDVVDGKPVIIVDSIIFVKACGR
jgi:ornithine cyclodeaminase/alanine dehydrogenase-like protein (mu-crystallin family)